MIVAVATRAEVLVGYVIDWSDHALVIDVGVAVTIPAGDLVEVVELGS